MYKMMTQWPGKAVAKSSDETAAQTEQAAPKLSVFGGPLFGAVSQTAVNPFATTTNTRNKKPLPKNDVSKNPSTSTQETPKVSPFSFGIGQSGAAPPSPSLSALLRQEETSSLSAEPAAKQSKTPGVNSADSKTPAK